MFHQNYCAGDPRPFVFCHAKQHIIAGCRVFPQIKFTTYFTKEAFKQYREWEARANLEGNDLEKIAFLVGLMGAIDLVAWVFVLLKAMRFQTGSLASQRPFPLM